MKWLTLTIGLLIIAGGVWLILSPHEAQSPEAPVLTDNSASGDTESETPNEDATNVSFGSDASPLMEDGTLHEETALFEDVSHSDPIFHALVTYTDDGFLPTRVEIQRGETVRFVNNGNRGVWIGGDNHPSHTIYPEQSDSDCLGTSFDTCRTLQAGEFWEFTFTHVGSWGYHNHVRARDTGTIIVR